MSGPDNAEAWANEIMLEREREAVEALNRCVAAGAKVEDIKTLARECGVDLRHIQLGERHAKN